MQVRYGKSTDDIIEEQKVELEKGKCFVYVDTVDNAKTLVKKLTAQQIPAEFVVGVKDITSLQRKEAIQKWESGNAKVLVGTDAMGVGDQPGRSLGAGSRCSSGPGELLAESRTTWSSSWHSGSHCPLLVPRRFAVNRLQNSTCHARREGVRLD